MAMFNGTNGNDIFTGGSTDDTAVGNGGNDNLSGGGGIDLLVGNAGSDTLNGGDGGDTLYSGDESPPYDFAYYGNDFTPPLLDTGTERDTLSGGNGDDVIFAGYGDNVDGGASGSFGDKLFISFLGAASGVSADFHLGTQVIGGGTITGIENISWVQGSNFDDMIDVGTNNGNGYSDFTDVFGMAGNDHLIAGYYTGLLDGGDGDDIVDGRSSQYLQAVYGGSGNDTLYTNSNTSAVAYGGDGNDTIYAHGEVHGGNGDDRIVMVFSYYTGRVSGDAGDDKIDAAADQGNVIAGGSGADIINGNAHDDQLGSAELGLYPANLAEDFGAERDVLAGFGGNDLLVVGYGDSADGGSGNDTLHLSLAGRTSGITFSSAGVVSGGPFSLGGGTIQNIENFEYLRGTDYADDLLIVTQAELLTVDAGGGDDVITSQNSSITVSGGDGNDRFVSGAAGDTFDGGAGIDTIDYQQSAAAVTVALGANGSESSGAGGDQITNVENIYGSEYADTLTGNEGANDLRGQAGDDTLFGNTGNDSLQGGLGDDTLDGGAGADTLDGGFGSDTVHGGDGDDLLIGIDAPLVGYDGTFENDTLDGGSGIDTVSYAQAQELVFVDLSVAGPQQTLGGGTDTLTSIENVIGSASGDQLAGDVHANVLEGADGDDLLFGEAGDDTLVGDAGDDLLRGGAGNDTLNGGAGTDRASYAAATAGVTVNLALAGAQNTGEGQDILIGIENLTGSAFNDVLTGDGGANILTGGAGNDRLSGGAGIDTASYGTSDIGVTVNLGLSTAQNTVGAGSDTLMSIENLIGSSYDDTLTGNADANVLDGREGGDKMSGGGADDTYVVDSSYDLPSENAGEGTDLVSASISWTLGANLENLTLTGNAAINGTGNALGNALTGNGAANTLLGMEGDDTLIANGGNDRLDGGAGADALAGGLGDDTFYIDNVGDVVSENDGEGTDIVIASVSFALATNVENLTLTGAAINGTGNALDNLIKGNSANNILNGGAGSDRLYGGAGDDTYVVDNVGDRIAEASGQGTDTVNASVSFEIASNIENLTLTGTATINATGNSLDNLLKGNSGNNVLNGGAGADRLYGGAGDDTYVIDNAGDRIAEASGAGTDLVKSSIGFSLGSNVENLTLTGSAAVNATGNSLANILKGNGAANVLNGGAGADKLYGGDGNDTYIIDNAGDRVSEATGQGSDLVKASVSFELASNVENLTLTGTAAIDGTGNSGSNVIIGNGADNRINGGAGADHLTGSAGHDTFVFGTGQFGGMTASTCDEITDFTAGQDTIALRPVDANSSVAGDQAFQFIGTDAFHNVAGELRYEQISGNTFLYGDTNGDGLADFMIKLDGTHALTGADIGI